MVAGTRVPGCGTDTRVQYSRVPVGVFPPKSGEYDTRWGAPLQHQHKQTQTELIVPGHLTLRDRCFFVGCFFFSLFRAYKEK